MQVPPWLKLPVPDPETVMGIKTVSKTNRSRENILFIH
jgi:hypothetical protein